MSCKMDIIILFELLIKFLNKLITGNLSSHVRFKMKITEYLVNCVYSHGDHELPRSEVGLAFVC